jgi:ubiquinone biosynthesis protein Coq4
MLATLPHLLRDPFDVERGVVFFDGVVETPPVRAFFAQMVAELPPARRAELETLTREPVSLDALRALPKDTFGFEYARRFEEMGFDPEFHLAACPESGAALERNWIYQRFAKLHDMHHVMLGVDVSPQAGLALQVFLCLNTRDPVACMFMFALPFFATRYGRYRRTVGGSLTLGRAALAMPNLFHFPYERHYGTPLVEVRRLAGVPAAGLPV